MKDRDNTLVHVIRQIADRYKTGVDAAIRVVCLDRVVTDDTGELPERYSLAMADGSAFAREIFHMAYIGAVATMLYKVDPVYKAALDRTDIIPGVRARETYQAALKRLEE